MLCNLDQTSLFKLRSPAPALGQSSLYFLLINVCVYVCVCVCVCVCVMCLCVFDAQSKILKQNKII